MAVKCLGNEQVLEVHPSGKALAQSKFVFEHFNIKLDRRKLFSRCVLCNCADYVIVPACIMKVLLKLTLDGGNRIDENLLGESRNLFMENFDSGTGKILKSGKKVNFEGIPHSVFDHEQTYFICVDCGKVYWEGGHFHKALSSFSMPLSDDVIEQQMEEEGK